MKPYSIDKLLDDGSNWADFEAGVINYLFESGAHFFIDDITLDASEFSSSPPSGSSFPSPILAEQLGVKTRSRTAADLASDLEAAAPPRLSVVSGERRMEACYKARGFLRRHLPPWLLAEAGAGRGTSSGRFRSEVCPSV